MNSLLQYCADSRAPRTDHIMYRFTQCSITHLQGPYAPIGVLTGVYVMLMAAYPDLHLLRWAACVMQIALRLGLTRDRGKSVKEPPARAV